VVANELASPTHCATTGYQHMSVFINGEYWGHYGGREVTNEYYVHDNHGADPSQVDQILTSYFENEKYLADEGTDVDFLAMSDFLIQNDMNDPVNFAAAKRWIDWENWVDYFAAEMYLANGDWFSSIYFNNTRMYRAPDVRWRYIMFDVTYAQGNGVNTETNILYEALANPSVPNRYTDMMNSLLQNPEFKSYFINRFADLINEYWTPTKATAIIEENATELAPEINRQSARWGSQDSVTWRDLVHDLREFHAVRRVYQRNQIQDYFGLNDQVDINLRVEPEAAGVIHINTIVPKNYPWAGIYFNGNPVTITAVANPGYTFDHWIDNLGLDTLSQSFTIDLSTFSSFTAHFTGSPKPVELAVSEINYQSDPTRDAGDWIEIQNVADYPIDLTNYLMQDREWYNAFPIPAGTILNPLDRLVIAEDDEKFSAQFPDVHNITGSTYFKLDNSGEQVRILDRNDMVVSQADYDNSTPWPCTPAGFGRTLERYPGINDPNGPESWFDGCIGGSPGEAFSPCQDDIIISEINYHSSATHDAGDWIELKNQLSEPLDLSAWTLRDENDDHLFTFPDSSIIEEEGYFVICENETAFSSLHAGVTKRVGDLGFGLGNGGDVIRIYDASGILRLSICYDDESPWTTEADGNGYTLELADAYVNLNEPLNWFAGCIGGSPGGPYDPNCIQVSTEDIHEWVEFSISPNPVSGELKISLDAQGPTTIRVVDMIGKVIVEQHPGSSTLLLKTDQWNAGLYFITAESHGMITTKKVVKQ